MADAISAKTAWALAKAIKGGSKRKGPTNGTATVVRVDQDGTHWVRISGSDVETPVNGAITVDAKAGDTVQYHLEDTRISITGNASSPSVGRDYVGGEVSVVTKQVEAVRAEVIETNELVAAKATIGQLEAERARIGELEADHVSVSDFQAEQANIDSLQAATADIDTIRANSAKVQNLTAAQLEADHAKVGQLDVSQIAADHATIGNLDTTYMHANMSNADVAWIQNGTIKDGAIVSAMINDVSANKLTAGTINGSVINVTNLNADNITAGTINGQRIGQGSLSLDKLSESVYTEAEVDTIVDGLNDRIDGAIETHTGTAVPTLNNQPASSWNTTKLKDEHVGDVYYVVNSQSQQNGYCYRFTKSGSTYSWQLIKDSDVTAALSRLTTAEGKITTFDSDISKLKTDTGTLTTKTESLETRMSDAEADILDKVDTTTFNEVSDTVDQHSRTISQMSETISNKADGSTVTAVTNRVSKNEQDISGINTTIGELQDTVETKADGSTVETVSNRLNTVSNTVDGHTQTLTSVQNTLSSKADSSTVSTLTTQVNNVSDTVDGHTSQLSSITTTQTTIQSTLDKTVKSSIQLWYSKANTTAPSKPTSQVTSTSTSGNAWRIVVPAYNASYPHYFYCWQYEYVDGTYGWSAVVRDIAMGESQSTARTADSNASAAVTTANTASTNASTALTTANTASTNASEAKTAATTASTTASEAKTTAETAASDASTAKTNAASAVTTANSASTTATNAQSTANANIKSSVQLWFTKANSTAPSKPTSVVSTSNANTANAWNLVVPVWNKSYPHYFYCYQQQKGDGNYQWTDVVYDRATSEAQQLANTTSTSLSTLQEDYATYKQTTTENVSSIGSRLTTAEGKITTAESNITQNAQNIELKVSKDGVISSINQSSESVSINANKINLQGAVTISDLSSDAQSATLNSNISVGGRNLVVASKISNGYLGSNGAIGAMDATRKEGYSDYIPVSPGESLVFQAWVTVAASNTEYLWMAYQFYNSSKTYVGSRPSKMGGTVLSDGRTYNSFDGITVPDGAAYIRVSMRRYDDGVMKLEKGNKATDWTPAPEDVDSAISDAAKTATSYVTDITGGGVMVHPSDDATSGVRITSDVDIMRSGTSVINIGANDAVRIGLDGSGHVLVDSSGMTVHNSDGTPCLVVSSSGGMEALYKRFTIGGANVYARTSPATEMYQVNFGTSYEFASGAILNIVLRGYAGSDTFSYTCRFRVGTSSTVNLQNALNKAEYQVYYDGAHYAYLRRTSAAINDDHTDWYYRISYAETTVNVHAPSIAMDGSVSDHAPYSSSFGEGLLVSSDHQTVLGRYNVEDANDSNALIIGNGLFDDSVGELVRSNALTVDWDGNVVAAGTVTASNVGVKTTSHSASGVTISAGGNYYASLGSLTAVDGFVPVGVSFNLTGMSNYANLFPSSLQDNGTYIWARIHNFNSSSSTGDWSATVYWVASN